MLQALVRDLRYGIRSLRENLKFTVVAVVTLALGISVNTTVFGWIDALLLNPFPGVARAGELVALETISPSGEYSNTAYRDYRDYRDQLQSVSGLSASLMNAFNVGGDDNPERVWGEYVSGNYFDFLDVKAVRGRVLLPEERADTPGGFPVAVISHRLWQRMFRSDPAITGKTMRVNRHQLTIIGVAPPEFAGATSGIVLDMWVPMVMAPQLNGQGSWLLDRRNERQMWILARLKPGVSLGQASAEVRTLARRIAQAEPQTSAGYSAALMPVWKAHVGAQGLLLKPLQVLMAVALVLFLIVAANVANLQLARATARQKEFSIRLALGAGAGRLGRQLLTESLLLALLGALAAIPLTFWMGQSLTWLLPPVDVPVGLNPRLNVTILGFVILLSISAAVITGIAPALAAARSNLNQGLKDSGRGTTSGAGPLRLRNLLVVSEVALALAALVATGLFALSFQNVRSINPGLDASNVLKAQYYVATFCRTREQRTEFAIRLHDRLMALPGVSRVSYSNVIPLDLGSSPVARIEVDGYPARPGEDMRVSEATVAPGFFEVMRIPLIEGRDFTAQDDAAAPKVAIVNQALAKRYFGGSSPVGRKMRRFATPVTIVGMARDSKYNSLTESHRPYMYTASRQMSGGEFWIAFFIRTSVPAREMIGAIRREAGIVDPNAGVARVVMMEDTIQGALYAQKVAATLLGVLGGVCLLLAAMGLYSVISYGVSRRSHEFGLRMAVGAQTRDVLGMVIRQGMALTAAGLAAGTALALAASHLAGSLLVGVSPEDPVILSSAALFLAVVALAATYFPARRATGVNPVAALRCE